MAVVISLYDYTGEALRPWAEAGYTCYAYDIQHDNSLRWDFVGGGSVTFLHADLHQYSTLRAIRGEILGQDVAFAMAFPVCTDMAVSGAAHFAKKFEADPDFQIKASTYAKWCGELFDDIGCPYFVENPVSVLASLWRKPDHSFHPYQFGGYIQQKDADHPKWPEYIPARDAYKKKTCLWTGGGFKMPEEKAVECSEYFGNGYSKPMMKLGGKSMKTKNIRSATPRGFAMAVFEANKGKQNG